MIKKYIIPELKKSVRKISVVIATLATIVATVFGGIIPSGQFIPQNIILSKFQWMIMLFFLFCSFLLYLVIAALCRQIKELKIDNEKKKRELDRKNKEFEKDTCKEEKKEKEDKDRMIEEKILEEIFENIEKESQGARAKFKLISEALTAVQFSGDKGNFIAIKSRSAVSILIEYTKEWIRAAYSDDKTKDDREKYDDIACAALITIANISVTNKINKGIYFINKGVCNCMIGENRRIENSLHNAQKILNDDHPNHTFF